MYTRVRGCGRMCVAGAKGCAREGGAGAAPLVRVRAPPPNQVLGSAGDKAHVR